MCEVTSCERRVEIIRAGADVVMMSYYALSVERYIVNVVLIGA